MNTEKLFISVNDRSIQSALFLQSKAEKRVYVSVYNQI